MRNEVESASGGKKVIIVLIVLIVLAGLIWAGYFIYKNYSKPKEAATTPANSKVITLDDHACLTNQTLRFSYFCREDIKKPRQITNKAYFTIYSTILAFLKP